MCRRVCWLLGALLWATGPLAGQTSRVDWSQYRPAGHITDYARLLGERERATLEGILLDLHQQYGVNLGLVTLTGLERYDIEEITKYLYEHWEMGRGSGNQAALMLVSQKDGLLHLYTGMGLRGVLDHRWTAEFSRQLAQRIEAREYEKASIMGMTALVRRIYENAKDLPRRRLGALPGRNPLAMIAGGVGGTPALSGLAAVVVIVLLGAAAMQGKKEEAAPPVATGRDFERNRTGPFGTKRPPRQL